MSFLENKIPPPLVMIIFAGVMWLMSQFGPVIQWSDGLQAWLSAGLLMLGLCVAALGVHHFRQAATTVNPLQPEKASSLVTSGVFQFTRNPMYLGMTLLLLSLFVKLGAVIPLLGVVVFVVYITRFQILPEERAMQTLFGNEFADYQSKVRRWL